jgi:hypothetical protein
MELSVSFRLTEASGSSSARYRSFYCNINFYYGLKIILKQAVSSKTECSFIVSPHTAALSHREMASAGSSRKCFCAQGHDKKNSLYNAAQERPC